MDFIKRFFNSSRNNQQFNHEDDETYRIPQPPRDDADRRGFEVFSDPLQMHRYFEHQMNEMLKMFGFHGFDNDFFSENYNVPSNEEHSEEDIYSKDLRSQFLKDGYEKPPKTDFEKVDKDIDGKMNIGDLESIFGRKNSPSPFKSGSFSFGQSKSIKTIKNPDGSVETHCTVRDSEGNEEVTICRKIEDKEYCIIKKKDKQGKEEIIENFVNLDEKDKDSFLPTKLEEKPKKDFPFDIFFK